MASISHPPSRAQISRHSIERLHIAMRHLFMRGTYKPLGMSGETMIEALLDLSPEIYGTISDRERVELNGLLYIFQRLPQGIEQSRYVKLITKEGFESSSFEILIPSKRRRNCYKIDEEQMFIEMTRGLSDIYDVLTHLTFLYIEAEKIRENALDGKNRKTKPWIMLEQIVLKISSKQKFNKEVGFTYLSSILGRTFEDIEEIYDRFEKADKVSDLFEIIYWMGKRSIEEHLEQNDREINFSSALRETLGHHVYGTKWAQQIKKSLIDDQLFDKPIHVISSNMHSVMNCLYAQKALSKSFPDKTIEELAEVLSKSTSKKLRDTVRRYALKNGMKEIHDPSGTNISVQIFNLEKLNLKEIPFLVRKEKTVKKSDIIVVMDYAFGQQAFETMDELLKPYDGDKEKTLWDVKSVSIMGKAGILTGAKGDVMIPNAHIFEGSADNYPFENKLTSSDFESYGVFDVFSGPMITVLGTSLQNKDILRYFMKSSWGAIGLEMEGAHYQKAIQAAANIRHSVDSNIEIRYAYYASDNPLESGATLASGSLGLDGVSPTYAITKEILKGILS